MTFARFNIPELISLSKVLFTTCQRWVCIRHNVHLS